MRSFFKIFFASLLAILVFTIVSFLIFIGIVSSSTKEATKVEEPSVLTLDLSRPMVEMTQDDPLEQLAQSLRNQPTPIGLKKLLESIHHAENDPNIKGIFIKSGTTMAGFAQLDEVRTALKEFKSSGKFIVSYANMYSEGGYYIASVADDIMVQAQGDVELNGLSAQISFYKGLLDKLGVEVQVFRVGDFKSAVEPFIKTKMSPENRLQTKRLLGTVYDHYLKEVSESRNIPETRLRQISDSMLVRSADDAKTYGLVTQVGYYDQMLDLLREKMGLGEGEKIPGVSLGKYEKTFNAQAYNAKKIAVIVAEGDIVTGEGGTGSIGSKKFAKLIRKAREDDNVKAIVLRVNSPGGSALASDVMWREVKLASKKKPIIASMSSLAASGGYYISMACDTIVAEPTTITGSIGIFGLIPNIQKLMNNKLGITFDEVQTGQYSNMMTITRPLTDQEKRIIQRNINEGYKTFTTKAAEGRHMKREDLLKIASGRVWSGTDAKQNGLVDVLGNFQDAVNIAARKAGLKDGDYMLRYYPESKPFLQQLMENLDKKAAVWYGKMEYGDLYPYLKGLKEVEKVRGIQARMPYDLEIH